MAREKVKRNYKKFYKQELKGEFEIPKLNMLPKDKDLSRSRPVVDCSKSANKKELKKIGRSLNVIRNNQCQFLSVMDAYNIDNVKKWVDELNENSKWKKRIEKKKILLIKYDIKDMYTFVDREDAKIAINEELKRLKKKFKSNTISIARLKVMKDMDDIGKNKNRKEFEYITANRIRKAINSELNSTLIKTDENIIIEQRDGVGMGGFISTQIATISLNYKENKNRGKWKDLYRARFIRIIDDILVCKTR
jgi:hypothetical protein